jgi:hypothetical protein
MCAHRRYGFLAALTVAACTELPTADVSPAEIRADHIPPGPDICRIDGSGTIETNEVSGGSIHGDDGGASGTWTHSTSSGEEFMFQPEWIFCRNDGALLADIGGTIAWHGRPATVLIHIQDFSTWGSDLRPLTATRFYKPAGWQDDAITPSMPITLPAALPVRVGNAGNQMAHLNFLTTGGSAFIDCRYQGGASSAYPQHAADISRGLRYEFLGCKRFDAVAGTWQADPALLPGSMLEPLPVQLHVQNGSIGFPTLEDARTTVSVAITRVDFLRVQAWDNLTGDRVYLADGNIISGDFTVQLPPL